MENRRKVHDVAMIEGRRGGTVRVATGRVVVYRKKKMTPGQLAVYEARKERRKKALDMRVWGMTPAQIFQAGIGYTSVKSVYKDLQRAYSEAPIEASVDAILVDLNRLDWYQALASNALRKGDLTQIDRLMRIMAMRHQLTGVDPEVIREQTRTGGLSVNNNGVMVVTGTTEEYLRGLMKSKNIDDKTIDREIAKIEAVAKPPAKTQPAPEDKDGDVHTNTGKVIAVRDGREQARESNGVHNPVQVNVSINNDTLLYDKGDYKPAPTVRVRVKQVSNKVNQRSTIAAPAPRELNAGMDKGDEIVDAELVEEDVDES